VVFFDVAEADLPGVREEKLADIIESAVLDDVVSKHVEECDLAGWSAHEDSVEVKFDLDKPGAYAAGYALPGSSEPLMERSVEFIAWASVMRATQRQRIARSELFTEAAKADMCKQDTETEHGERVKYDRSGHRTELVCSCCGSSVGIGETMTAHRSGEQAVATDGGETVGESGEAGAVGVRVGERVDRAAVRERAEKWVEENGESERSTPGVLGELGVSPEHADVVSEVVKGEEPEFVEKIKGPLRESEGSRYELQELKAWNGDSEEPGVGGSRTVELKLPVEEMLQKTRLQYVGEGSRPKIRIHTESKQFATYNPRTAARALVNAGLRLPWVADRSLSFEHTEQEEFEEPVPAPGG
jgi:hypothetical protein